MSTFWLCVIVAALALLVGAALGYWTAATDLESEKADAYQAGLIEGREQGRAAESKRYKPAATLDEIEVALGIRPDDEQAPR